MGAAMMESEVSDWSRRESGSACTNLGSLYCEVRFSVISETSTKCQSDSSIR
jgi:hypothetical protein